jgi:hypothetical protein
MTVRGGGLRAARPGLTSRVGCIEWYNANAIIPAPAQYMQKCSARAAVTPSGSRSDERRMHAQRGGHAFRSGQRNHFAIICLAPDSCAPRPSVCRRISPGPLHSAVPPCALVPSIRLYGSASLTVRANHGGGLISRRKRQTKKPRREGPTARRGVVGPRRKRGSPFHQADLRHAFIKGGGCRYDSRLWNPQIALTTLMSGHAVSYVGQAGGCHSSSTFCAAPPATSKQHG